MNLNLRRRLESLEQRLNSGPIVLLMPDGTTQILRGQGDYASQLLECALRGEQTPDAELIAQSIGPITEPGNSRVVELARALIKKANWVHS
jgi:hypothetical protein